jgi:hypothetical protein
MTISGQIRPFKTARSFLYLSAFFYDAIPEIFTALAAIFQCVRDDLLDGLLRSIEVAQEA